MIKKANVGVGISPHLTLNKKASHHTLNYPQKLDLKSNDWSAVQGM